MLINNKITHDIKIQALPAFLIQRSSQKEN